MKNICAKQTTLAVIQTPDGELYWGYNKCLTPQSTCPRDKLGFASGEGYNLYSEVCKQLHHAEVSAVLEASKKAIGATLTLYGHTYCCDNCLKVMKEAGIKDVYIAKEDAITLAYRLN